MTTVVNPNEPTGLKKFVSDKKKYLLVVFVVMFIILGSAITHEIVQKDSLENSGSSQKSKTDSSLEPKAIMLSPEDSLGSTP